MINMILGESALVGMPCQLRTILSGWCEHLCEEEKGEQVKHKAKGRDSRGEQIVRGQQDEAAGKGAWHKD